MPRSTNEADMPDEYVTVIHICAGPPACELEDEVAVKAQQDGCVWCRRIIIHADGRETETGPSRQ